MLKDLLDDLIHAKNPKEKAKAYQNLRKVGVDQYTADILVKEIRKKEKTP